MPKTHVYDSFEKSIYRHSYFISPNVHWFLCFFQGGGVVGCFLFFGRRGVFSFTVTYELKSKGFCTVTVCMTSMTS